MSVSFLLLEIADPEVNAFLWSIRDIISGKSKRTRGPIHLTLRGPYEGEALRQGVLESARKELRQDVLQISGVGRFSNGDEEVVFFRVNSSHLREVWWKPSFPIERFGFEPHISVYRGQDVELADRVASFLSDERIELLCAEHRLVWHEARQPNMFVPQGPTVGDLSHLYSSNRIDVSVLDRLRDLVDEYGQAKRLAEFVQDRQG